MVTETICGLAAMISSRIAQKVLSHDAERINHFVFSCLTGIPATLLSAASLRSGLLRRFAVPCLALYTVGLISNWIRVNRRQEKEEDLVCLILMSRAGYDATEAVYYRDNMITQGKRNLKNKKRSSLKVYTPEQPMSLLEMGEIVIERLKIDRVYRFTRKVRYFGFRKLNLTN